MRGGGGHGNRRLHRLAVFGERTGGNQADRRTDSGRRNRSHFASPGYCRTRWRERLPTPRCCLGALAGATYGQALDPNGLKGARIGVARQVFGFNDQVDRVMEAAIDTLKSLGAEVIDPANIPTYAKLSEPENDALLWEFKADLNTYLETRGAAVKSLKDVIDFNERNREREMPYFGQDLMIKAEAKGPLSSKAYRDLVSRLSHLAHQDGIDLVMTEARAGCVDRAHRRPGVAHRFRRWRPLYRRLLDASGRRRLSARNGAGRASIRIAGGLSFFGSPRTEVKLIKYAYAFEQAAKARRAPQFLPTLK